jgi:hypothetical protein
MAHLSITTLVRGKGPRAMLAAMALGVALALPSATFAAGNGKWTANMAFQYGNSFCGADHSDLPVLGELAVSKHGKTLNLRVTLDGSPATANTSYELYLYSGGCANLADLGQVTTDAFGVADVTFKGVSMSGQTTFFATLYGGGSFNDTAIFPTN